MEKKTLRKIPSENKIITLVGPTGSGKSAWAKILASKFNSRVISADSRQIYQGLDIGTAKDKSFNQEMVDIITPAQPFSVADYQEIVTKIINKYLREGKTPILVGGTGLYIDVVLYGYVLPNIQKESQKIRERLEKLTDAELYSQLQKEDPESAARIDPRNKRRVVRALEYTLLNDIPFSKKQKKQKPIFKSLIIGIEVDRETLYARVDARVEEMVKRGLVEEVRHLIEKYPTDLPALNTIGYKEIIDYLRNRTSLKEAIQQIKFNTHDYVRRQMTWFRRDTNIKWVKTIEEAENKIKRFLKS